MKTLDAPRWIAVAMLAAPLMIAASTARAEVRKIVIDKKVSPAFDGATFGSAGQYETVAGRAYGELDPNDPLNAIITDIRLAPKNARGKVEYVTTFFLVKPIDMMKSSHLMQDVPNRGGRLTIVPAERAFGDIGLSSGWQGDRAGSTVTGENNDYVIVPIATNADGSPITGPVIGRIVNVSGPDSQQMFILGNPMPEAETVNALRVHFRDWVMKDTPPPASVWPTLADGFLVDPTKAALGFPTIPGLPPTAPTGLLNPVKDYDWGRGFNYVDGSGVKSIVPPIIKRVVEMKAVRSLRTDSSRGNSASTPAA